MCNYLVAKIIYVFKKIIFKSNSLSVFSGVPEGGVICRLLFKIYINYIAIEINIHSDINLFADNAKISSKSNGAL